MNAKRESVFTMEGHFGQDVLDIGNDAKPSKSNIVTLDQKRVPEWYRQITNDLYAILSLNDNWDSYGANRISSDVAKAVDDLLIDIMQAHTPAPQTVPSANGSIQLEWHISGIDLEIEVESLSTSRVCFEDGRDEEGGWEGEINYDLSLLVHYINLLTERAQAQG